jgi:hypothetical protein
MISVLFAAPMNSELSKWMIEKIAIYNVVLKLYQSEFGKPFENII